MQTTRCAAMLTMVTALALPAVAVAQRPKCSASRDGRCVVVEVNGQTSVEIRRETRKLLQGVKTPYVRDAKYELAKPVRGDLDIRADGVPGSTTTWFGELKEVDVSVVPLQSVALKTEAERATSESVRAGGAPVVTERQMVEGNRLPAGRYLLVVTLRGASNWDRQVLFFEVEEN